MNANEERHRTERLRASWDHQSVSFTPRGDGRDVHWCWLTNEPFTLDILTHDGDKLSCPYGCPPRDPDYTDWWDAEHPFICHIHKPTPRSTP